MNNNDDNKSDDRSLAIYHNIASSIAVLNSEHLLAARLYLRLGIMFIAILAIIALMCASQVSGSPIWSFIALFFSVIAMIAAFVVIHRDYEIYKEAKIMRRSVAVDLAHLSRSIPVMNSASEDYLSASEESRIRVIQDQLRYLQQM